MLIPLWGMIGIWTQKFGWDFLLISAVDTSSWHTQISSSMGILVRAPPFASALDTDCCVNRAYNAVFGLFQAPYYAFGQTMMAELTPPGFDNMV
jgi:hypothetical protein